MLEPDAQHVLEPDAQHAGTGCATNAGRLNASLLLKIDEFIIGFDVAADAVR